MLYAHGFDPATAERYRRIMARSGAERVSAPPVLSQVAQMSDVSEGWRITADHGDGRVETVFEILRYEDIVRQWQGHPLIKKLWSGLTAWFGFIFNGGLKRVFSVAKGPGGLFFYPVMMLALFIGLGVFAGRTAGEGAEILGAPDWASQIGRVVGALVGLYMSVRFERAFFAHLMLALFDFLFKVANEEFPAGRLEMRVELFAHRIAECVNSAKEKKVDEILIVGHSLGGLVAVRSLARAMEQDVDLTGGRAKISLLTLGSVSGYVSCHGGVGAGKSFRESIPDGLPDDIEFNPGGLAVVWSEENSRTAIFNALKRKEVYGTSGPRFLVRFFLGDNLDEDLCSQSTAISSSYQKGVPMGGTLNSNDISKATLFVSAKTDQLMPDQFIEKIQVVKGVLREDQIITSVHDIQSQFSTDLNPETCEVVGTGVRSMCTVWSDPNFKQGDEAYYYVRVIANKSCRWSQSLCVQNPEYCKDQTEFEVPKFIQERAWTSPIWLEKTLDI